LGNSWRQIHTDTNIEFTWNHAHLMINCNQDDKWLRVIGEVTANDSQSSARKLKVWLGLRVWVLGLRLDLDLVCFQRAVSRITMGSQILGLAACQVFKAHRGIALTYWAMSSIFSAIARIWDCFYFVVVVVVGRCCFCYFSKSSASYSLGAQGLLWLPERIRKNWRRVSQWSACCTCCCYWVIIYICFYAWLGYVCICLHEFPNFFSLLPFFFTINFFSLESVRGFWIFNAIRVLNVNCWLHIVFGGGLS